MSQRWRIGILTVAIEMEDIGIPTVVTEMEDWDIKICYRDGGLGYRQLS